VSSDILKHPVEVIQSANTVASLTFIFIGRLAKWKRPDKCVEFISYFAQSYNTSIKILGFEKLEFEELYGESFLDKYKNLSIKFLGVESDVKSEIVTSDINLYFDDSIHSY
jgi:hypothetical protein